LIYNSEATKKAFNIDGSVIYNGVEAASVDNKPVKHSAVKNLLVIGRINDWKGQDLLLDAISKVSRSALENINVRIVGGTFGGNNDFFDKLKLFVHQKKLDNHVSFHNFTNDPSNHFLWSDWVIVPSKRPEPFGRVAVEAFAYSKPVVAANHGGLAEILTNKVNGYFFAPNSSPDLASVIEIIHDLSHGEYIEFSKAALAEYNKRFSEASYQKYLYDNIVGL
jgi:glycosyltransferase involved in cell wall biosynthesis